MARQLIDIFILYKREQKDIAKTLAELLVFKGYTVWWDADLLPGDKFIEEINEVISTAKASIVLWADIAIESSFVVHEATLAHGKRTTCG